MSVNLNEGHRARLRERFLKSGADGFCEHELLELLLCYAIPRKDVKPIAKTLLRRFGSIPAVLNASREQLLLIPGLGENSVVMLKMVQTIAADILPQAAKNGEFLRTAGDISDYLMRSRKHYSSETMILLLLDHNCRLLERLEMPGNSRGLSFCFSDISAHILQCPQVRQVVMAHNHPGNNPLPSRNDINSTIELKSFLGKCGITLLDHFIISDRQCVSVMKAPGYKEM